MKVSEEEQLPNWKFKLVQNGLINRFCGAFFQRTRNKEASFVQMVYNFDDETSSISCANPSVAAQIIRKQR